MDKECVYTFLSEIENLQMFALCKDFDKLSLKDDIGPSQSSTSCVPSSSYGYRCIIDRFLHSRTHSLWCKSIIEQLRAPFIEFPRNLLSSKSYDNDIKMGIGFRFLPGQTEFLNQEFHLPKSFDRFSFLYNSLGLSYNSRPLFVQGIFPYSWNGAGLRGFVNDKLSKVLVEVITYYKGMYGRFFVLVCLGVGCTVWYAFAPGSADHAPASDIFSSVDSYDPFFKMDSNIPNFRRVCFVERNDVTESVASAFVNEHPFAEIEIPASGHALKAVGLGLMVAFFLAVGIVPNVSGYNNVQL